LAQVFREWDMFELCSLEETGSKGALVAAKQFANIENQSKTRFVPQYLFVMTSPVPL
jgi:hypothetical protein